MLKSVHMTIDKIVNIKNFSVLTVNGTDYSVDSDSIILFRLKQGDEIDDNTLAALISESEKISCRKYLYSQIDRYSKTEKGYRDKLKEKGYRHDAITYAIACAKQKGYIDDKAFAERYYEKNKNKKGINRIFIELKNKGVAKENLEFILSADENPETALSIAEKFMKKKQFTDAERLKLMRHLAQKGFSYDTVIKAVNVIFSEKNI